MKNDETRRDEIDIGRRTHRGASFSSFLFLLLHHREDAFKKFPRYRLSNCDYLSKASVSQNILLLRSSLTILLLNFCFWKESETEREREIYFNTQTRLFYFHALDDEKEEDISSLLLIIYLSPYLLKASKAPSSWRHLSLVSCHCRQHRYIVRGSLHLGTEAQRTAMRRRPFVPLKKDARVFRFEPNEKFQNFSLFFFSLLSMLESDRQRQINR